MCPRQRVTSALEKRGITSARSEVMTRLVDLNPAMTLPRKTSCPVGHADPNLPGLPKRFRAARYPVCGAVTAADRGMGVARPSPSCRAFGGP